MEDLPPGFRFYPTEEELVSFYLYNKLEGRREDLIRVMDRIIPVLDIYDFDPSDLPQISAELSSIRDPEQWFFFIPRQESEARGGRPRRVTANGYWKATGSPSNVYSQNRCIGGKRTMVFYQGRAPNGYKTDWKMNEYKLAVQEEDQAPSSSTAANPRLRHEFSLCRVYKKSKCIRSFDRRPVGGCTETHHRRGPIIMTGQPEHQPRRGGGDHHDQRASATSNTQWEEKHTIATTRSPEDDHDHSSSSGDQGISSNNTNMEILNDEDTFLNWDQFNSWFHGGDDNMGA